MQHTDGMHDTRESEMSVENGPRAHEAPAEPPIVLDPNRKLGPGPIIGAVVAALALGAFIVVGIRSRVHAEETLTKNTQQASILPVAVTTPKIGASALEIPLPPNTQASIQTP